MSTLSKTVTFGQNTTQNYSIGAPPNQVGAAGTPGTASGLGTASPFGAAPAPGTFGAAPSPGGFGAAPSNAFGGVGTTTPSTTSPFGGKSAATSFSFAPAPAAVGTGGFGSGTTPSPGTTFGGGFSSTTGTSLFGTSFGSTTPAPGGSTFGSGGFGSAGQPPANPLTASQAMTTFYHAQDFSFQTNAEALLVEVQQARTGQLPAPSRHQSAPFWYVFYQPASAHYRQLATAVAADAQDSRVKPSIPRRPHICETEWNLACANAPDGYEPVAVFGAKGLFERKAAQQMECNLLVEQMKTMNEIIKKIEERHQTAKFRGLDVHKNQLKQLKNLFWQILQKFQLIRLYRTPLTDDELRAFQRARDLAAEMSHEKKQVPTYPTPPPTMQQGFPRLVTPDGEHPVDPAQVRYQLVVDRKQFVELINSTKKDLRDVKLLCERFTSPQG